MKETAALIGILAFVTGSVLFAVHEHVKLVEAQAALDRANLVLGMADIVLNKLNKKSEEKQETTEE